MKVTPKMVEIVADGRVAVGLGERLQRLLDHLKAEGLLVEPFDPAAWDEETEPPVGYRVVDRDAEVWCHGDAGWGTLVDGDGFSGGNSWGYLQHFAPFALVPGGPVPWDRW